MSLFRSNIRTAINDEALQIALDKNADQRLIARQNAYADLSEDFSTLKKRAHAARKEVLSNLDSYLKTFSEKAQENGFTIHLAENAKKARQIILEIALEKNAKLISKSKSMMSEEIDLNPALEAAGIEVVETDLGEYIVQLRGEHPSHIITPAVHLRREDVGETFHQKLGMPLTDDIQILTNTARSLLRQTFLNTDIGISGVNMGVVENGSICILTNEGNGRMVTTVPEVHIALMGIERLVPDLETLSLIVKMLPRSATGQKITVYTQLISGPRKNGEIDGAAERHLILIDNGRTVLNQTPLAEALLCIRCGACINACPIFREIGGFSYTSRNGQYTPYPGPIGSVLSPGLFGQADYGHLAQASTLCGACKEACPMDIDLPSLLLRVRSGEVEQEDKIERKAKPAGIPTPISFGLKTFTWFSTRPNLYAIMQKFAGMSAKLLSPHQNWLKLPAITGWGYSKDFPRPSEKNFRDFWKPMPGEEIYPELHKSSPNPPQVQKQISVQIPSDFESTISRFNQEFTALNGKLIECDLHNLGNLIGNLLKEKGTAEIMAWEAEHLPYNLIHDLREQNIQIDFGSNPDITVGLTGANAAIAETGTLVLAAGPGRPFSTSLLPETHIAILNKRDIYENLPQVFHLREILNASSVILISGPSRTADIEMTLTIGVHGPEEVYVFLLDD